jgi:hypothetical protein
VGGALVSAAISMHGIKTLDEMHAKRSQRNYQQQQKWWKQRS